MKRIIDKTEKEMLGAEIRVKKLLKVEKRSGRLAETEDLK